MSSRRYRSVSPDSFSMMSSPPPPPLFDECIEKKEFYKELKLLTSHIVQGQIQITDQLSRLCKTIDTMANTLKNKIDVEKYLICQKIDKFADEQGCEFLDVEPEKPRGKLKRSKSVKLRRKG